MHEESLRTLCLLVPSANNEQSVGEERDKVVPNGKATSVVDDVNFYKIGMLLGLSLIHYDCLPFKLPSVFWKYVLGLPINWKDYESVSINQVNSLKSIEGMNESELDALEEPLIVYLSGGKPIELEPDSKHDLISVDNRKEYSRKLKEILLSQLEKPFSLIRKGMVTIVPEAALASMTPESLEKYICGSEYVDTNVLKKITLYEDFEGNAHEHPSVIYFWNILDGFTQKQLSTYLKFVWGRSRLGTSQTDNHKLTYVRNKKGKLPEAHTCFFQMDVFDYDSEEEMKKKLMYAMEHGTAISENDNRFNVEYL